MIYSINDIPELYRNILTPNEDESVIMMLGYCIDRGGYCYRLINNEWRYIDQQVLIDWYNGVGRTLVAAVSAGTGNNNNNNNSEKQYISDYTSANVISNNCSETRNVEIESFDEVCNHDWTEMVNYRYQYDIESVIYRSISVGINSTNFRNVIWLPNSVIDDIDINELNNNLFKVNIMFRSKSSRIKPIFIFHDDYVEMLLPSIIYNDFVKIAMESNKDREEWDIFGTDSKLLLRMTGCKSYNEGEFYHIE